MLFKHLGEKYKVSQNKAFSLLYVQCALHTSNVKNPHLTLQITLNEVVEVMGEYFWIFIHECTNITIQTNLMIIYQLPPCLMELTSILNYYIVSLYSNSKYLLTFYMKIHICYMNGNS